MDINGCLKESQSYYVQIELFIFCSLIPRSVPHLDLPISCQGVTIRSAAQAKDKGLMFDSSLPFISHLHVLQPSVHLEILLPSPLK